MFKHGKGIKVERLNSSTSKEGRLLKVLGLISIPIIFTLGFLVGIMIILRFISNPSGLLSIIVGIALILVVVIATNFIIHRVYNTIVDLNDRHHYRHKIKVSKNKYKSPFMEDDIYIKTKRRKGGQL